MSRRIKNTRKCISCNKLQDSKLMIKILKEYKSKEIIIEPSRFEFGRSAYICKNLDCINKAFKKSKIYKILKINQDKILEKKIRAVLPE